jgi:hypothetical protein
LLPPLYPTRPPPRLRAHHPAAIDEPARIKQQRVYPKQPLVQRESSVELRRREAHVLVRTCFRIDAFRISAVCEDLRKDICGGSSQPSSQQNHALLP